jgi:putative ABC transport system permease protein
MTDADRRGFRRVFRLPFTRSQLENAVDDELRFHLEERIREFQERGMSREQAEFEARRRFGDYDTYRQEASNIDETTMRDRTRAEFFDTLRREMRHAATTLLRSPSFSLITCLTLALGLGAATTIFTLLDRVVLRPLAYPNAERMVHIGTLWPFVRQDAEFAISRAQFFYFKQHSATLADLGLYDTEMLPIPGDGEHATERVPALYASASLFSVLGIAPERGRLFTAEEGVPRHRRVALISHGYWVRRHGSDPSIVGKRVLLGADADDAFEIIGVLPAGANVPDFKADIWIPNWLDPAERAQNNHTHSAIGVAKLGVTIEQVDSDVKRVEKQFEALWPDLGYKGMNERGFLVRATWLQRQLVGDKVTRALWILFGSVAVVLLIAAANVANLFLVRIDARRREVAVRTALGAGRQQLAVLFLGESLLLAAVSAVGAVLLSYLLLHVVLALAPQNLPRLDEVSLDWRGVTFCIAVAIGAAVVFGLLPLGAVSADVKLLREGGRGLTTSRGHNIARRALVVSQVALAVVLFSGAALMVKSYARLRQVRPGFDPAGVVSMDILLPYSTRYQKYQQVTAFWHQLADRVGALPGVVGVGATETLPLTGQSGCTSVATSGALHTQDRGACVPTIPVAPGYFETMRIRVKGATPDWSSTEAMVGPVVLSKAFADQFFPDEDPVGRGIKINSNIFPFFRIVGVAEDVRSNGLQKPPFNAVYFPLMPPVGSPGWDAGHYMSLVVRAPTARAEQLAQSVRGIVKELDPQVPVDNVQPMEVVVAKSMAQTSFTMMLLLISAAIALALSAVGIYGVISYVVSHRRAEIGIRMALGAQIGEVAQMVVSQSLMLAIVGVGIGTIAALLGTRLMQSLLFEVRANDPAVLVFTPIALLVIAGLASFAPARRAARVDPVEALRSS